MEQTCVRHTTNLCCILFKLSVKLPAASVPPKVSQHLNSPNRSNTSLMVEVMRMEKTINLRLYINHPIFSKLTIKNTNTQLSISIVFLSECTDEFEDLCRDYGGYCDHKGDFGGLIRDICPKTCSTCHLKPSKEQNNLVVIQG